MDKDVEGIIEFFQSKNMNLWELDSLFESPADVKTLKKMFPEPMFIMLKTMVKQTIKAFEFHNTPDSGAHENLLDALNEQDAKLQNHRHDTTKTFSAKAEF